MTTDIFRERCVVLNNMNTEKWQLIGDFLGKMGYRKCYYQSLVNTEVLSINYIDGSIGWNTRYKPSIYPDDHTVMSGQEFIDKYINKEQQMNYSFTSQLTDIDLERIDRKCNEGGYEAVLVTYSGCTHGVLMLNKKFLRKFAVADNIYITPCKLNKKWGYTQDRFNDNNITLMHYRMINVRLDQIDTIKQQLREAREFLENKVEVKVEIL